jgi:hypothetical protein
MTTPRVAATIDELIAGATDRVEIHPDDGKSGSDFELLTIDGEPMFLKVVSYDRDWIMRCSGNTDHWEYKAWCAGLYQRVPPEIDTAMVAMALDTTEATPRLAMLMHDISDGLIPAGDTPVPVEQHERIIDHMAAFHVAFWGWRDTIGISPIEARFGFFSDANIAREMQADEPPVPIRVARDGWAALPDRAPKLNARVQAVRANPQSLGDEMRATPLTFVAGDWKMGNLGSHADGRTIVLDWAYPGASAPCLDLTWYLAINAARIPISKEDTIAVYRAGLERRGIATDGWFEPQLRMALLGAMCMLGWEKALGGDDELAWWEDAVTR